MAERILSENKHVQTVSYSLPNKHYIPVDMRYAGIDNLTPCVSLLLLHCFLFCFLIFIARFASAMRISSAAFLRFVRCSFTAPALRYSQSSIICYHRRTISPFSSLWCLTAVTSSLYFIRECWGAYFLASLNIRPDRWLGWRPGLLCLRLEVVPRHRGPMTIQMTFVI